MAKPKEKSKRLKRLYKQLARAITMDVTRPAKHLLKVQGWRDTHPVVLTQRGRIEHAIQTLERAK